MTTGEEIPEASRALLLFSGPEVTRVGQPVGTGVPSEQKETAAASILDDSLAPDVLPLMMMGRRLLTGRFYTDAEAVAIIDQILLPSLERAPLTP